MSDKAVLLKDVIRWLHDHDYIDDMVIASGTDVRTVETHIGMELPTFTPLVPLDKETIEGMKKASTTKDGLNIGDACAYNHALDDVLAKCGKPTLDSIETPEETAEIDKEYEEGRVKSFDNPEKAIEFLRKQPTLDRERVAHIIHMFVNKATANQVDIFGIKEQSELAQAICDAVDKGELT